MLRQRRASCGSRADIKKIREDGKIDLCLQKRTAKEKDDLSKKILDVLKEHGGTLDISDKTSPEKIYKLFGVSKKRYKSAIGALYKKRLIKIEDNAISLTPKQAKKSPKVQSKKTGRTGRRIKAKR